MSAGTVEVPPGAIELGVAEPSSTIHGLKSTVPRTALQPALPGPALQPHQLFSAVTKPFTLLSPATLLLTIRLKPSVARPWLCTSTPVALFVIVLPVSLTGWLPAKFTFANHWKPMLSPDTVLF